MAFALYPYALTTLQKVKDLGGITDSSQDTIIQQLINAYTDFVENYCGGRRFLATDYTEIYDAIAGRNKIFLRQRPVISLTSVSLRGGAPSSPTWTAMNVDNYLLYAKPGYVSFFGKFGSLMQAFQVIYRAGYLIDWANEGSATHTLPSDLTLAVSQAVLRKLTTRKAQGIQSETTEGQSITFLANASDFTKDETNILDGYKAFRYAS